jgi:hypothetical protein
LALLHTSPLDSQTFWLLGIGVAVTAGLAYAIWANPAAAATGNTWPTTQFAPSQSNVTVTPGQYVQLLDASYDVVIVAHVNEVNGTVATGTVISAPSGAPESYGDTVQFLTSSVIAASSFAATLVA